ncbi:CEN-like protein 1-like isoform X2 [Hibiscus syriacus]|uniref:CEN-like protein 1-like isoform X2 n=1 Tax=Hibiscus syriacus TaxID=106335 RepID=A0A6A2ZR21_HIBSY|nr:CEN-like protein 1-like isoform X2 [Hibiscus syriacus]
MSSPTAGAVTVASVTAAAIPVAKPIISPSNSGDEQSRVISSGLSPSRLSQAGADMAELMKENEKLRKQNVQLNKQLAEMQSLCNNIFSLMSNYASQSKSSSPATKQLDLLPSKRLSCEGEGSMEEEMSPRLFGVPIGGEAKRARELGEGLTPAAAPSEGVDETHLQLQQPGGSETRRGFDSCTEQIRGSVIEFWFRLLGRV